MLIKYDEELSWKPHPTAEGFEYKTLLTKKEHNVEITCNLIKGRKGAMIPEHIHENSDDIIFPLSGKIKMWIDGIGEFKVERGVLVRVPKKVKHKICEVLEEFVAINIFTPATL